MQEQSNHLAVLPTIGGRAKPLTDDKLNAWLRFIRDRRWSTAQKFALLNTFSCPSVINALGESELRRVSLGRWRRPSASIKESAVAQDRLWLDQPEHHLIVYGAAEYPQLLKQLPDPPLALFAKGDVSILNDPAVAVVGSRKPTPVGQQLTHRIACRLAECGVSIASGMALGIDGVAHRAALERGGNTVAVMGCGLDTIYPARHRNLFEQIALSGCLLSEFPLGVPVSRNTFPRRNRLVSGLSLGTLIVEAAARSGTLITARLTMEQNRPLMVVPGSPLSQQYAGSHALLQQGAALVTCAQDILHELQLPLTQALEKHSSQTEKSAGLGVHSRLLEHIYHEPTSIDSIIQSSGLTAAEVSSMLLALEVDGLVGRTSNGEVVKLLDEN